VIETGNKMIAVADKVKQDSPMKIPVTHVVGEVQRIKQQCEQLLQAEKDKAAAEQLRQQKLIEDKKTQAATEKVKQDQQSATQKANLDEMKKANDERINKLLKKKSSTEPRSESPTKK